VKAGRLNQRVTLQERADPEAVTGSTWADVETFWAEVVAQVPNADREGFPSEALRASTIYHVKARWRDGVQSDQRLLWRGLVLNIANAFDETGARREIILVCEEGLNNG